MNKLNPPKNSEEALERVRAANDNIASSVEKTPLAPSAIASTQAGSRVFLKYESQQRTGSFKIRGALNKMSSLSDEEKSKGVCAASAGNHSQGVAFSAQQLGIQANIVMPETAPLVKVQGTRGYGANVLLQGEVYDDAYAYAQKLSAEEGLVFIHPYQDDLIIAGQGTIGLEILDQIPELDSVVVPVGGGGLIAGVAMVAKAINPNCRVYGVQAASMPGMSCIFQDKDIDETVLRSTIADGLAVKTPSKEMYEKYISKYVDDIVTVKDEEIAASMVLLLEREKAVVEGAGACSLAGAIYGELDLGKMTSVILSGGNVDLNTISKVIQKGLTETGRLASISINVDDQPGTLSKAAQIIGQLRANILQVDHNRAGKDLALRETRIDFLVETNNEEHVENIRSELSRKGIRVV